MDNTVAANTLGIIGAVCWSVQLLPQIILNYRRHNATGLQPSMMMFWAWAGVPLGVYNISEGYNVALVIQPQVLAVLSLSTWVQCYYYEHKWSVARCAAVAVPIACCMGGIEIGLVFALREGAARGIHWPSTLMAVLAALFLALGVLRHYYDIWVHRTVRGISFLFVGLDALGDLTSLLSVLFQPGPIDVLGLVIYGVELTLWIGIFACGGYYNFLPWLKRQKSTWRLTSQRDPAQQHGRVGEIALHDLPSSTSVFRTPSSDVRLRTDNASRTESI